LDPPGGNRRDGAHSQMMIFVRNNGITPVLKGTKGELLHHGVATSFKVCQQICAVNYSRPFFFLRILSNNVHFLPFVGRDSYPVVKRCMRKIVTMHILTLLRAQSTCWVVSLRSMSFGTTALLDT
jgi:hypothetical protein